MSKIKVLFLHGSSAAIGGHKHHALEQAPDLEVVAPQLPYPGWRPRTSGERGKWITEAVVSQVLESALAVADTAAAEFKPDVIVGSSMGGALAIGVSSPAARVLIAPAMALRCFAITLPNVLADRRLPVRSVILHAKEDEIVPFEESRKLVQRAVNREMIAEAATMTVIQEALRNAGYDVTDGRLIRIGHDHACNDPHPNDVWNADPHPHHAMIQSVRILAGIEPCS